MSEKGYGLVLDCGEGRLAYELARQTDLQIVGLERDPGKLAVARTRLQDAGLWGSRVVVEPWDVQTLPDYFANLIVSDGMLRTGETAASQEERNRVLRPWGGTEYLSFHESGQVVWKQSTRGPLEGAGSWTQQFADPQNTACSMDELVHGPLGILWFGEPGPQGMVERHAGVQAPVALAGRLFIQGENIIRAVDAFNGTLLWQRRHTGRRARPGQSGQREPGGDRHGAVRRRTRQVLPARSRHGADRARVRDARLALPANGVAGATCRWSATCSTARRPRP